MNKETAAGAFFYRPEQGKRIGLQYLKQHSLTGKITIRIIGVRFIMKKLGFGLMRLPLTNAEDPKSIDLEQLKQMTDEFLV